jgi:glycogen phosphorylase
VIISTLKSRIPQRIYRLEELAFNIWWSWHPLARDVFRALDYTLWRDSGHNPVKLLIDTSADNLAAASEDTNFLNLYDSVISAFDADLTSNNSWFSRQFPTGFKGPIAYFSMEYALHNSLPIYAGGLGILAGDMCKEASDLGLPLVAVGFMYPQGYFHQHISPDGWQQEINQLLDFRQAPIRQLFSAGGERALARVKLESRHISIGVWEVKVGRIPVYLLDTDLEENGPEDRILSARLYASDQDLRIQQEIVLGIGGVRVLRTLGIHPAIWHANEGHSAFMGLERAREEVERGDTFESALQKVKASAVFTTHTPVASGHDSFQYYLMDKYFGQYCSTLGVNRETFLDLGRPDIRGFGGFNMTALAMKTSGSLNAVSLIHKDVSRKMWQPMWPQLPEPQVPISNITNGIHVPTWIGFEFARLFDKYLGKDWIYRQDDVDLWDSVLDIPDEEIWTIHRSLKNRLIEVVLERAASRWREGEVTAQQMMGMGTLLNGQALTIGYARRCTDYKRPTLLLHNVARLKKMVNDSRKPVQIIFSGKAHPADFSGKQLLKSLYQTTQDNDFMGRIAFVEDYDMHLSRYLVRGVDIWLNIPYRLQEASGTSGMKAGLNGVLNFSVRDGWWNEGYNGLNGWAVGQGPEGPDYSDQNVRDTESIYSQLEQAIIPLYYDQDRNGIPRRWVKMIKESIRSITPRFSGCRMVKDYTRKMYSTIPGAVNPQERLL